jgi:hypothetical protein
MADSGNPTGALPQESHEMMAFSEPQQLQPAKRTRRARAKSPPLPVPSTPLMTRASKRKATENLNSSSSTFAGECQGLTPQVAINVESHLATRKSQASSAGPHHPRITFKKRKTENDSISTGTEESTTPNISVIKPQATDNSQPSNLDSEAGPSTRSKKPKAAENTSSSGDAQVSKTFDVHIASQPTAVQASGDKSSKNTSASATNWRRRMRKQEKEKEALENAERASSSSMGEASQVSATTDNHNIEEQLVLESPSASALLRHAVPGVSAPEGGVDEQSFAEILSVKNLPPSATGHRGWGSKGAKISTSASSSAINGPRLLTPTKTTRLEDHIGDEISRASSIVSMAEVPRVKTKNNGSVDSATPSITGKQDTEAP